MDIRETLSAQLDRSRRELLDLTARNRLLNVPRHQRRGRYLEIVDEKSDEIFRMLVGQRKRMGFQAREESEEGEDPEAGDDGYIGLPPPEDEDLDEDGIAARHRDSWLQTTRAPEALQKQLLRINYDARTTYEEQGINILYLALGMLEWYDSPTSDRKRFAPLVLIPVDLERGDALRRFRLSWTEEDIAPNLSLVEKFNAEFGIKMPEFPDVEDLVPSQYFNDVRSVLSSQPRFAVHEDHVVLGFFSFAKLRMYHDLDPASWPEESNILSSPLIGSLLTPDGFHSEPGGLGEDGPIDPRLDLTKTFHVVDADSSQSVAIEEVRQGRNLVIQGPPGTGKSQTICNLIAAAVAEGKKVLFVAEKMAALEVVKRRLEAIGLGRMCLELHGRHTNKREVLEELQTTLNSAESSNSDRSDLAARLVRERDALNAHAERLHEPIGQSGLSPYKVMGQLVGLREKGAEPVDFGLADIAGWEPAQFEERLGIVRDLITRVDTIGLPSQHSWRGVGLGAILPTDEDRFLARIQELEGNIAGLATVLRELHAAMGRDAPDIKIADIAGSIAVGSQLVGKPNEVDGHSLADPVWQDQRSAIKDLVEAFQSLEACHERLDSIVADAAWSAEVAEARNALATYGKSMLRILNGRYRRGAATLKGLLKADPPKALEEKLNILDTLMAGQKAEQAVKEDDQLGSSAFGKIWRGVRSDAGSLKVIEEWDRQVIEAETPLWFRSVAANVEDVSSLASQVNEASALYVDVLSGWKSLCADLSLDVQEAFEVSSYDDVAITALGSRLEEWQAQRAGLLLWNRYRTRAENAIDAGLGPVVGRLYDGRLRPARAEDAFLMAYYEPLMRQALNERPELAEFDGDEQRGIVSAFGDDDQKWIELNRVEVSNGHIGALPRGSDDVGQLSVLRREFEKKRRHLPIRQLLRRAGLAVQAIKPVFMMSPLSIAQFIEPGALAFDLLLVDEASQVQPVDALGAVARCRQIVVVGDSKQLPPTQFFTKLISDDDDADDDDDVAATADIESILGLCAAQGMPDRMLRWHYRSRHPSLITVSNHEFYDDRLFVVPNPYPEHPALGLKFNYLPNGVYDRGGSRTNKIEAEAVADAVMRHARDHPDLTLGVGCFSVAQRDAILNELELRWRDAPEVKDFFAPSGNEPFFVKNLENIQGDERDVIFVSVGYARNANGYMAMSFGPVSAEGGERRLNVLISRARQRCEVFSSITADDVDLARGKGRGVAALKTFLNYAGNGILGIAEPPLGDFDSPFEEEVAKALSRLGHEVHGQVGVAGFRIDLAVVDRDRPGRYLLGIECDGAAYHSARSARDRDRLRQQVLEDQGWLIHRIWSTDWFRDPEGQLRKCEAAIEDARNNWAVQDGLLPQPRRESDDPPEADPRPEVEQELVPEVSSAEVEPSAEIRLDPYKEASFDVPTDTEPQSLGADAMAGVVATIVQIEGPVHEDEVARRVTGLWGLGRTGRRISEAVKHGIAKAVEAGSISCEDGFCECIDPKPLVVRDRTNVSSTTLRNPEMLPPIEILTGLLYVARRNFSVGRDEIIVEVGRNFGFRAVSAQIRSKIEACLEELLEHGLLKQIDDQIQAT